MPNRCLLSSRWSNTCAAPLYVPYANPPQLSAGSPTTQRLYHTHGLRGNEEGGQDGQAHVVATLYIAWSQSFVFATETGTRRTHRMPAVLECHANTRMTLPSGSPRTKPACRSSHALTPISSTVHERPGSTETSLIRRLMARSIQDYHTPRRQCLYLDLWKQCKRGRLRAGCVSCQPTSLQHVQSGGLPQMR